MFDISDLLTIPSMKTINNILNSPPQIHLERSPRKRRSTFDRITKIFTFQDVFEYKPPKPIPNKKTLILDLDETLIHSCTFPPHPSVKYFKHLSMNFYIFKRPGLEQFLQYVKNEFDLFIYTYSEEDYANPILNEICPFIDKQHRLFRDSCSIETGKVFKDIEMLERPNEDIIILDDNPSILRSFPSNTLQIEKWTGNPNDDLLISWVIPLLEQCKISNDVREIITPLKLIQKRYATAHFLPKFLIE